MSRPTGEAIGLPGKAYTDPAFFEAEREVTFSRNWLCAGVDGDLPSPGSQVPLEIAGVPVRDADRAVRAFHNICRHRGAQLVPSPVGRRPMVVCPYHAGAYALDGSLMRTPSFCGPGISTAGAGRAVGRSRARPQRRRALKRHLHAGSHPAGQGRWHGCSQRQPRPPLSPLIWRHLNFLGRYDFALPDTVFNGGLRPLRNPAQPYRPTITLHPPTNSRPAPNRMGLPTTIQRGEAQ